MLNGSDHEHAEHEHESSEDLLDLNEVMQAFGIDAWQNLGPVEGVSSNSLSLLVSVEGQNYVLRERPEGMLGEDIDHRYRFQHYLQQAGIPIPALWRTPQDEPYVVVGEDAFELQQWPAGEQFATADPHSLEWVASAGAMLGRIHQASRLYTGPVHRWPSEAHIGAVVQSYLNLAHNLADEHPLQAVASALANWAEQWEAVLPAAMMSIGSVRICQHFIFMVITTRRICVSHQQQLLLSSDWRPRAGRSVSSRLPAVSSTSALWPGNLTVL